MNRFQRVSGLVGGVSAVCPGPSLGVKKHAGAGHLERESRRQRLEINKRDQPAGCSAGTGRPRALCRRSINRHTTTNPLPPPEIELLAVPLVAQIEQESHRQADQQPLVRLRHTDQRHRRTRRSVPQPLHFTLVAVSQL